MSRERGALSLPPFSSKGLKRRFDASCPPVQTVKLRSSAAAVKRETELSSAKLARCERQGKAENEGDFALREDEWCRASGCRRSRVSPALLTRIHHCLNPAGCCFQSVISEGFLQLSLSNKKTFNSLQSWRVSHVQEKKC